MIVIRDHLQYRRLGLLGRVLILIDAALTAFLKEGTAVLEDDDARVSELAGSKDSMEGKD